MSGGRSPLASNDKGPDFGKGGARLASITEERFSARAGVATQVSVLSSETDRKAGERLKGPRLAESSISIFARVISRTGAARRRSRKRKPGP